MTIRGAASLGLPMLFLLACVAPLPPAAVIPASACTVGAPAFADTASADSLVVAVASPIDPHHVPAPTTSAERFAFAQAYETLVDVDCTGHAYPGLARSWTRDQTATRITIVLRDDARFWDGSPLRASDVLAAWRATGETIGAAGELARRTAEETTIVDERTLIVSLPDTGWLLLAKPALAVYRPAAGIPWPDGSGSYRPGEPTPRGLTMTAAGLPRLELRTQRSADVRDAIDAGADVIPNVDPLGASYAATRPDLMVVPLPWTHAYVLVSPDATQPAVHILASSGDSAAFRVSLARDAVRAAARPGEPLGWWTDSAACARSPSSPAPTATRRSRRIVYHAEDPTGRQLAERLVALGRDAIATALAPDDFARALRAGDELAYVLALPRTTLTACDDRSALLAEAPWLAGGARTGASLASLVDTRASAIVNRRRVRAVVDWDGTLRIAGGAAR